MTDLGQIIFEQIYKLIIGIIDDKLKTTTLSYLEQRRIRNRVENATAEVVESLIPFLQQEKVHEDKLDRLIGTCIRELQPFTVDSTPLFQGSLDGQIIFDNLYHEKGLPEEIIEDGLKDTYELLFPRIATLMCKIPATVKDWENEAWTENYRRFDEVVAQLKALFTRVDELATINQKNADSTLNRLKRILTQKVGLQLDITGLRAGQPYSGRFDDFFVLPEIELDPTNIIPGGQEKLKKVGGKLLLHKNDFQEEEPRESENSINEPHKRFSIFTEPNKFNIVIGTPGSGKSTWSKWLQKETLKSDWSGIGIRIEFRDLKARNLPSTYNLIRSIAGTQMVEDLTPEKINNWLKMYQILFIFDGFDEIKPVERDIFVEWIKEVLEFAKGCPFVVTSRPITTNHLTMFSDSFNLWSIKPFNVRRITDYINKWYSFSPLIIDLNKTIDASNLAKSWAKDPTIGPLTGNPLLLSTLLMVHHLEGKLPSGRSNLYKTYVDGMLGFWDERNQRVVTDIILDIDVRRKIVSGIALYLFSIEQDSIEENLLIAWLEKFLPKIGVKISPIDVLLILRERTGFIIGPGIYNFAHKTIAEYFVAECAFQGDQQNVYGKTINNFHLFEHRDEDRYNTVIFLWAGIASFSDVCSFINECINCNSWSLAYGLLLDQYLRFSVQSKKDLINKLVNCKEKRFWSQNHYWTFASGFNENSPWGDNSIHMPNIRLNGLSEGYSSIYVLLRKLIEDETIVWEDYSNWKGIPYQVMWGGFVTTNQKPNLWKKVLLSPIPNRNLKIEWKKLIAQWIFTHNKYSSEDFQERFNIYKSAFSDFEGYIPIVLMDSIIAYNNNYKNSHKFLNQSFDIQFIIDSLSIIFSIDLHKVTPFLTETKNWPIFSDDGVRQFEPADLIIIFQNDIEGMKKNGLLILDHHIDILLTNFVNQVLIKRESINL